MQTFVSRTRLAVQKAEDMTATTFEEDNISVLPSDQGQAPGKLYTAAHAYACRHCPALCLPMQCMGLQLCKIHAGRALMLPTSMQCRHLTAWTEVMPYTNSWYTRSKKPVCMVL